MQPAPAVRGGEPTREVHRDAQRVARRQRLRDPVERAAANELVNQVRPIPELSDAVDGDDIGMLDPRRRARLDEESLPVGAVWPGRRRELDGDVSREDDVLRQPDRSVAAAAELAQDDVVVEFVWRSPSRRRISHYRPSSGRVATRWIASGSSSHQRAAIGCGGSG
jgi:hypothetical protein